MEYIELPLNLEMIGKNAFAFSGLRRIDFPANLKTIEKAAFWECQNLSEINFNYGLQIIREQAFTWTKVRSINLPGTVKMLEEKAFLGNYLLKTVIINGDCTGYQAFTVDPYASKADYKEMEIERIVLNYGVTSISSYMFGKCNSLKDITILNPECVIPSDDFITSDGHQLTVHGYRDSTAKEYADKHGYIFIPLDPVEEVTTTTAQTTTTTTTTVTAVASTVVAPDSECVFMIVNEDKAVPDEADKLLDESNLYYFDQETADENGNVKFGYVPDNSVDRLFIFISEVVNGSIKEISRSVGKPGDMKTTVYTQPVPTKEENVVFGDTNGDGEIDMSDAVLIMQSISNPNKYGMNGTAAVHMTEAGKKNADVYDPGSGVTSMDALTIQRYLMGIHTTLPVYKNS